MISLTVDGINFIIHEPKQIASAGWLNPKSSSAGLMYKVAVSMCTNNIVSINGAFQGMKGNG